MCSSQSQNPKEWRFTWETQSHIPTIRLYLFNPHIIPASDCAHLRVDTSLEQYLLTVSFIGNEAESQVETSLRVPIPRVLVDFESPVHSRVLDDHIEVKLGLLVPVDHPLGSNFDSVLNSLEEEECGYEILASDGANPLSACFDLQRLSAAGEVHFYCRSCSTQLTRGSPGKSEQIFHSKILYDVAAIAAYAFLDLKNPAITFKEMPSVHWRDVADNWFGTCCCSFGGISEKLVLNYAKSYLCAAGLCLLSETSVIISIEDILEGKLPNRSTTTKYESDKSDLKSDDINYLNKSTLGNENDLQKTLCHEDLCEGVQGINKSHFVNCCTIGSCENPLGQCESSVESELPMNQKIFLNGYLGDVFMARPSSLSKDIEWIELFCPKCAHLLGAYPSRNNNVPLDGGVRLYKFYITTSLPANGAPNLFRSYTFERVFTNQLLGSAKDELSFRTVVRDLHNQSHSLQIVLLNPNTWNHAGFCLHAIEPVPKINVYPAIKVLFSPNISDVQLEPRNVEWVTKKQAQEVYLLPSQMNELIARLENAHITYPPSHTFSHGFSVSSLKT